ncbi:MAG: hypothetical protein Q8O32_00280 [bacterium]|nr:hypothetical protein [bacterium]
MNTFGIIINDFFKTAFVTWLLLVIFELLNPGMVQRFINLEYYFYLLILIFILAQKLKK